jgi:hypothetical protein
MVSIKIGWGSVHRGKWGNAIPLEFEEEGYL